MLAEFYDEFVPVTAGEILAEEFLPGFGLSQVELARALDIPSHRIAEIVHKRRRITADTALRLGLFFGTTPEFWQNLQAHDDLKMARRALSPEVAERIVAQRVAESAQATSATRWGSPVTAGEASSRTVGRHRGCHPRRQPRIRAARRRPRSPR
jgi:addiction module HigA family antidote